MNTESLPRRILLVYANGERSPWPVMPIGLSCVASALQANSHEVRVLDLMFQNNWPEAICQAIREFSPEVVGISIRNMDNVDWQEYRFYLPRIKTEVVEPIRRVTDALIMIGGPAVNIMPRQILEYIGADCALFGDGEETAVRFLKHWNINSGPVRMSNVIWNHELFKVEPALSEAPTRIADLGTINSPKIHQWISLRKYRRMGTPYPIQTKRGCAFKCSFCVYRNIEGADYRLRPAEQIADEIEAAYHDAKVKDFEFTDSVFNHPLEHALAVCHAITARKLDVRLNTSGVNPRFLTRELLNAMEEAGFEEYSMAPDSAAEAVLRHLGKGYVDPAILVQAAEVAKSSRLPVLWWFSFGLPGESAETVEQTLDFMRTHLRKNDCALCTLGIKIYPGTLLADIAIEEGQTEFTQNPFAPCFYEPQNISLAEIGEQLKKAAMKFPNMIITNEGRRFGIFAALAISLLFKRLTGSHRPVWSVIPTVNRLRHKLVVKKIGNGHKIVAPNLQ